MKIYDTTSAPNPRRVRIFLAEKGISVDYVPVDIMKGEHFGEAYKAKNPYRGVPTLELDDGTCIAESVAICRYFEELHPETPLFGRDAKEKAIVEMWNRRVELYVFMPVAFCFRHTGAPFGNVTKQVPEWGELNREAVSKQFHQMNKHFAKNRFLAGDYFSIADISLLCAIDFARVIKQRIGEDQEHLKRWHTEVSSRASAKA